MDPEFRFRDSEQGATEFLQGLLLGAVLIVLSWLAAMVLVGPEDRHFPLAWAAVFSLASTFTMYAMRRHDVSRAGYLSAIAIFILLDSSCWVLFRHV